MKNGEMPEDMDPNEGQEAEGSSLDWLLKKDSSEMTSVPMDTNVSITRQFSVSVDHTCSETFKRDKVFKATSQGDATQLHGLLGYLRCHDKRLTSPEFTGKVEKNNTIEVILDIAEKTGDLENLINASYTDPYYKGQTPLHVAIERRSFAHVKLLVQKGAEPMESFSSVMLKWAFILVGNFILVSLCHWLPAPTSLILSFLMENPYRRADVTDRDSQGNTVLHTLVVIADNTKENTDMIAKVYDEILVQHNKLDKKVQLEEIENNDGMTPLKLAAKLGKIELFRHMLHREFMDEETKPLSRKFTEWIYEPVPSSLYDMTSIDTDEKDSVLEIIVFGSEIPNRPEMLQIQPLRSLLQTKWERFASKLFLMNFLLYVMYLTIFTTVTFYRKEGQPPFPIENIPLDHLRCVGELISILGALRFLYKTITLFWRNPPTFNALFVDGFTDILFFLQAALLLICVVLYGCGLKEYVGLLVLSLALAWVNLLYYLRGSKQLGMYTIVALIHDSLPAHTKMTNDTAAQMRSFFEPYKCVKFTIGMGDLQFTDQVQYKEVFYILLICYIILTYILLLNMLIALMGNTVERISTQSENIWNLQRAFTILDMERTLPRWLRSKLQCRMSRMVCSRNRMDKHRRFFRVEEMNWKQWRSDLGVHWEEEPANDMMVPQPRDKIPGNPWNLNMLLERIHSRRQQRQQSNIP
ncbi:heterogeneous nuclear ribonucleoprotein C1/C2 [Sarotherodon galilaeus]